MSTFSEVDHSPAREHARHAAFSVARTAVPYLLDEGPRTEEVRGIVDETYERYGLEGITLLVEQLALGQLMKVLDCQVPDGDLDAASRESARVEMLTAVDSYEQAQTAAGQYIRDRIARGEQ